VAFEPARRRQLGGVPLPAAAVVALVLLLCVATVGAVWVSQRDTHPATQTAASSEASNPDGPRRSTGLATAVAAPSPDESVLPVQPVTATITPVAASGSSSAPDSVDDAGRPVAFGPLNAIDGVRDTAWRPIEGDGVGESLTLDLGATYAVTSVGLVPGYDKVDPTTGRSRFLQNRRIAAVRWVFDDDSSVVQQFADEPALQTTSVSAVTRTVRIQIEATRAPASGDPRNFAPVSEVLVEGSAT